MNPAPNRSRRGLSIGLLGIVMFAGTLPMARLSVGTAEAPQMSGYFVTFGRAVLAAGLSAVYLLLTRASLPPRAQWTPLAITCAGVVFGFPLFTSLAMRYVEAVHASVIVGILPLATAAAGALVHRQRPSPGFWLCAALGSALVAGFAVFHGAGTGTRIEVGAADLLLLAGMLSAAIGYAYGARLAVALGAENVICWCLLVALPVTLPLAFLSWPEIPVRASAWWGLLYAGVFSMWLGFFAWYRGLAMGGTVRVSQVQLAQPFLSMVLAVPLLGETLDLETVGFALAVIATVFIGRRMPVRA